MTQWNITAVKSNEKNKTGIKDQACIENIIIVRGPTWHFSTSLPGAR